MQNDVPPDGVGTLGRRKRRPLFQAERDIQAEILVAVTSLPGAFFVRQNTGAAKSAKGKLIRFGRPGQPDIVGCYHGRYVAIEVKTKSGRQSPEQRRYQEIIETVGGVYILARSKDEAVEKLLALS